MSTNTIADLTRQLEQVNKRIFSELRKMVVCATFSSVMVTNDVTNQGKIKLRCKVVLSDGRSATGVHHYTEDLSVTSFMSATTTVLATQYQYRALKAALEKISRQ